MGYWRGVLDRATRETLALTPWSSPAKAIFGLAPPLAAGTAALVITGSFLQTGVIAVLVGAIMAAGVFVWKLVSVPPAMAAEAAKALAETRPTDQHRAALEEKRRQRLIEDLAKLYQLSTPDSSLSVVAGLDLPPVDWLNEELAVRGEDWQILETRGREYWTFEIRAMTSEERAVHASRSGRAVF